MTLVDTSIWIDHLRSNDQQLTTLLTNGAVLVHACVIGELALGALRDPETIIAFLNRLPKAVKAEDAEVLRFIRKQNIGGLGIGYVDAHLLASVLLTPGASFWTRDKRLKQTAALLSLAAPFA